MDSPIIVAAGSALIPTQDSVDSVASFSNELQSSAAQFGNNTYSPKDAIFSPTAWEGSLAGQPDAKQKNADPDFVAVGTSKVVAKPTDEILATASGKHAVQSRKQKKKPSYFAAAPKQQEAVGSDVSVDRNVAWTKLKTEMVVDTKEEEAALPLVVLNEAELDEGVFVSSASLVLDSNAKMNAVGGVFEDTLVLEAMSKKSEGAQRGVGALIS